MKRLKIGVDIDDVLVDTMKTLLIWHNRRYGTSFVLNDAKHYQLWKLWGGDRAGVLVKMKEFLLSEEFRNMMPDSYTMLALKYLSETIDLFQVTSRIPECRDFTRVWSIEVFGDIFQSLHFSDHCVDGNKYLKKKSDFCQELELDILVEDCLEYALECAPVVDRVYLMDKPWNQCKRLPKKIRRIKGGWRGLYCSIRKYQEDFEKLKV